MKADVCLLYPVDRTVVHYRHRPPLGLMYVASYLEKEGISSVIIDKELKDQSSYQKRIESKERKIEIVLDAIKKSRAKYVGISCFTPEYNDVISLAQKIKAIFPDKIIIVGGVHPTLYPEDFCYPETPVDYAVIGEGEITMAELVHFLESNKRVDKVKGIMYYDREKKKSIKTSPRPLIQNLDDLPFPAFDKVDMTYYTHPSPYSIRGVFLSSFYVLTSRGCPSRCTFCVAKKLRDSYKGQQYIRFRSAGSILKEVELLKKKYLIDSFYIIDDFFAINQKNCVEFYLLLQKQNTDLLWGCETKVTALREETIRIMRQSGCVQIDFGVESGSQKMLALMKKDITVETTKKVFSLCRKYGIRTFANILFNLPGETKRDLSLTIKLLNEIKPTIVSFNIFTPYLGTEIYDQLSQKFKKSEYYLLAKPAAELIRLDHKRFRFARHRVDIDAFARSNHKRFNRLAESLKFYFEPRYLRQLSISKRKKEYFFGSSVLVKEFIRQKILW